MQYLAVIIIAALTFGVCYLFDKGFDRAFRNKAQHKSGLAVRVNKRYAAFGAVISVLGLAAIFTGLGDGWLLIAGGIMIMVIGIALIVYYATFGIFYDADSFIYTHFGKKSVTYLYKDIQTQQLYTVSGNTVIELHMKDGRNLSLQAGMIGVYPFMDIAFAGWCRQTGRKQEECSFYDPANSCWFPPMED